MHHLSAHKEKTEQATSWNFNQTEAGTFEKDPFDTTIVSNWSTSWVCHFTGKTES